MTREAILNSVRIEDIRNPFVAERVTRSLESVDTFERVEVKVGLEALEQQYRYEQKMFDDHDCHLSLDSGCEGCDAWWERRQSWKTLEGELPLMF